MIEADRLIAGATIAEDAADRAPFARSWLAKEYVGQPQVRPR